MTDPQTAADAAERVQPRPHLQVQRIPFDAACCAIAAWHRHHKPPRGHVASFGAFLDDGFTLVGVATVGRPVARAYDNGHTLEVTRVATDGTPNACSALYAAARRWALRESYTRLITYTQDGESGASLRGAGWHAIAHRRPRRGWNMPSRPRTANGSENIGRTLWEAP